MKRWLAAVAVCCFSVSFASAHGPRGPHGILEPAVAGGYEPLARGGPIFASSVMNDDYRTPLHGVPVSAPLAPQGNRPAQYMLNRHGMACYAHHNEFGCGSFHSEMRFWFGSCRAFFSETCTPNPPHHQDRRDGYGAFNRGRLADALFGSGDCGCK